MPRIITQDDYLRMLGLGLLLEDSKKRIQDIERTLARIVGEKGDPEAGVYSYYGRVSDAIWEDDPIEYIMQRCRVEVK